MFILKRKKKKKNIPSLFSSLSLLIVRLLEFLSVWNTLHVLKKRVVLCGDEKNKNNLTSLIVTMNVKLISLHKI